MISGTYTYLKEAHPQLHNADKNSSKIDIFLSKVLLVKYLFNISFFQCIVPLIVYCQWSL